MVQAEWDDELLQCPECGGGLSATPPENVDAGLITRLVSCEECTFTAKETWEHQVTEYEG